MPDLSHLNALRALEASVRHGSFKAAADELGVTPAAVGQLVRSLEAALGQSLLIRRSNRFEPTEVAVLATKKLAAGFDHLREAMLLFARNEAPNRLFVTVNPTIAERWLAPRMAAFLADQTEIDLRIDSTPQNFYDENSEFDFGLRYAKAASTQRVERKLFGEVLVPLCAPEIAFNIGPRDRSDALTDVPLLYVDRSTTDPDWIEWEEWGHQFGYVIPELKQGLKYTLTTMAIRSGLAGHGLFLGQLSIALPDLNAGRLVAPFGPSKCWRTGYSYRLVSLGSAQKSPLQTAFSNWIVAEAEKTRGAMDAFLAG
jgi:LysR family glycine cleavage system transcriptional activator